MTGTRGSSFGEKALGNRSFLSRLKSGKSPLLPEFQKVWARMRKATSDEQRAAIARAIADDGQAGWVLSPDPATIEALVEGPAPTPSGASKPTAPPPDASSGRRQVRW